jgi:division/cell wall cluster transcriptional repressor MraZ
MTDNDPTEHGGPEGSAANAPSTERKPVRVFGQFEVQLDLGSGRFNVPKKLQPAFEEVGFLCKLPDADGLAFWVNDAWEEMRESLSGVTFDDLVSVRAARFFGTGSEITMDGQKRVTIPPSLRDLGKLTSERLMLVAMGKRIEFWAPEAWAKYSAANFTERGIGESLAAFAKAPATTGA